MTDSQALQQRFTHALLSPLTVILGSLEMLLNQDAAWPGYAQEVLELALAQAQRLHDTLDDLLATAEIKDRTVLLSWSFPATPHVPDPDSASASPEIQPGLRS